MGYDVDLITFEDAECVENTCIEQNLRELRIPLTVDDFDLHLISEDSNSYNDAEVIYDIFFTMGIKKLPQIPMILPPGRYLNVYFCQFPFDWLRGGKDFDKKTDIWAAYDHVLVNSKYTYDWYAKATIPWIHRGLHRGVFVPSLSLVYHPVLPIMSNTKLSHDKADIASQMSKLDDSIINIAVVGPFVVGDTTAAHSAIRLFKQLISDAQSKNINLFIIGKVTPTAQLEQFEISLRGNMTDSLKSKVEFLFSSTNQEISKVLSSSLVLWDLTYINPHLFPEYSKLPSPPFGDPFPVTMIESMFNGVIPISVNLASLPEFIIPNFNGFLGRTDEDFIDRTKHIISLSAVERTRLRLNSMKTAYSFGLESFQKCFSSFTKDAIKHNVLTKLTRTRLKETWDIPLYTVAQSNGYVAVLLAPSMYGTLELEVRNIASYLGQGWTIQVHHTKDNRVLCGIVLGGIPNVQYVELRMPLHTDDDYNRLLKSEAFWTQFQSNEKVLIFTVDSYLLRFGIRDYLNYEYVAPPLPIHMLAKYDLNPDGTVNGNDGKKKKHSRLETKNSKSNLINERRNLASAYVNSHHYRASHKDDMRPTAASFSLRSVKSMLSIIREYGRESHDIEPEAIFFLKGAVKMGLKIPSRATAYSFAVQYDCNDIKLASEPPLAIHHAWKYYDYEKTSEWINSFVIQSKKSVNTPAISQSITPVTTVQEKVKSTASSKVTRTPKIRTTASFGTSASASASSDTPKSSSVITSASIDSGSSDITKAWEILHNADLTNDPAGLKSLLDKLGVEEADDLKLVDPSSLRAMAETLKPIPKNKFLKALHKV